MTRSGARLRFRYSLSLHHQVRLSEVIEREQRAIVHQLGHNLIGPGGGLPQAWELWTENIFLKEEPSCAMLWSNRIFVPDISIVDKLQRRVMRPDLPGIISLEKSILLAATGEGNGHRIKLLRYQDKPGAKRIQQLMDDI